MKTDPPASHDDVLSLFHPLIARWFEAEIGPPTDIQRRAWPPIAAGEHVLVSSPTGSGKTLAAFLWAIQTLLTRKDRAGRPSVLYVSPLKALNNDIQRNLLTPLGELHRVFSAEGILTAPTRVLTRSGDTPAADRRRMLIDPPEILITTPESLNLLLSSKNGRRMLTGVTFLILDEIHAVVSSKRGVHLITAVERLAALAGEFQRIALSATVRPLETVAAFVGGFRPEGDPRRPRYIPRPVRTVLSPSGKSYQLRVRFPGRPAQAAQQQDFWSPYVEEIGGIIARNRATLVFTNSRGLCEKLTHRINQGEAEPLAYSHHGSLAREIRLEVERRLKNGDLRAIVATHSLELGIDIGALDEVVLLESPASVASAVQRIGRAATGWGMCSRAVLLPTHPPDLLCSAVLHRAVLEHDIEPVRPVHCRSTCWPRSSSPWRAPDPGPWTYVCAGPTAYPYRDLPRRGSTWCWTC